MENSWSIYGNSCQNKRARILTNYSRIFHELNQCNQIIKIEMKQNVYVAPEVEIVEVAVEKGFAGSNCSVDIPIGGGSDDTEWG